MQRIYKYQLVLTTEQDIAIPENAIIQSVQTQKESPCIWALVDPDAEFVKRTIFMYGTGHIVTEECIGFIGTFQLAHETLVFHVYEKL